ncbi:MAG: YifB family Mg chelatase-like AAA ATPase [Bacteroidales bacterium]|nr:YifB family Mg chelatase-like AAA ATPase [Bacteroidales bacterium]
MLINIVGAKCIGIDAVPVLVEVKIDRGIGIHLVGLADVAVKESLLRTVTALQSMDFHIPGKKIVINLAPADLHKNGSGYDLPIALGIIAASGQRDLRGLDKYLIMGELGLDGSIRPVPGALPYAEVAVDLGLEGCILPAQSALEAVEYRQARIYGVDNLEQVLSILEEKEDREDLLVWNRPEYTRASSCKEADRPYMDFSEIIGQEAAKRAAEVAVAGGHNLILIGPPGGGKSSLAKAITGILPPMTLEESLVTSKIYSVSGLPNRDAGLIRRRPFRAPHYSASLAAIVGGGNGGSIVPGEISLAHNGVLFCDEFAQMPKSVVEALRAPMEDRKVVVSRLRGKVEYPASFMLVAATNPCPCGYYGDGDRCTCTVGQRLAYLGRLSGPIMDRIDLQIWVHPVDTNALLDGHRGDIRAGQESSAAVAARVVEARQRQHRRFGRTMTNAEMDARAIQKFCPLDAECEGILEKVINKMGLSARAFSRIIKLSRTIADLDKTDNIEPRHILEAASYRFLDRRDPI